MKKLLSFIVFLLLCFSAAWIGNIATFSSVNDWFQTLEQPPYNPPRWLFAPAWTTIYLMMATAGYLLWQQRDGEEILVPMTVFGIQLVLNALWPVLFFGMQLPGWAFLEICLLWSAVVLFILLARPVSRAASWLFVPYAAWLTYAGYLNYMLWYLN